MDNKKVLFGFSLGIIIVFVSAFALYSCGGSGSGEGQSGVVALYITDDMSGFQQVTASITAVQVRNTGTGASCDILTTPVTIDITNLADVMHLVDITDCPAVPYNRLRVEFEQAVQLTDTSGASSACSFTTYKDEGNRPNALHCDPGTGICSVDVTGAVNVFANATNKVALDFDLKEFEVSNFGDPATCAVSMKVFPLRAEAMQRFGRPESITGSISALDTDDKTFVLTRGKTSFTVDYSGISASQQPGISELLQLAQNDHLRVKVVSSAIDPDSGPIHASAVYVKTEGIVSGLDEVQHIFTVLYKMNKSITVYYGPPARVEGVIADTVRVEVKLYGFDSANSRYLAYQVEREYDMTKPADMKDD